MILKNVRYIGEDFRLRKGDILIDNGIIKKIRKKIEIERNEETFYCDNYIVLPGLANAHSHNPDTLTRGIFKDTKLADWCGHSKKGDLQKRIFEYLDRSVSTDDFEVMALKSYIQYIKQGITFIIESGQADFSASQLEKCIERIGLKANLDLYDEFEEYKKSNGKLCYSTHFPEEEDINKENIAELVRLNKEYKPFIMTHCLETQWRREEVLKKFSVSTVELLEKNNLISEKSVLFHCVHVSKNDIELLKEKNANVVYCPVSNMWSSAGEMPIERILEKDINVMLATDFIYNDFWEVMKTTYYKLKSKDNKNLYSINDVFKMATSNSALISGNSNYNGKIIENNSADLFFVEIQDCLYPLIEIPEFSNVLHNIIFHSNNEMIKHVIINGRWIMKDRKILTVNEDKINMEYKKICKKIFDKDVEL